MRNLIITFLIVTSIAEISWGAEGIAPPADLLSPKNTASARADTLGPPANFLYDKICFDAPEARVRHQGRQANIESLLKGGGDYCLNPNEAMRIVNCPNSAYKYFNNSYRSRDIITLCDDFNQAFCEGYDCGLKDGQQKKENSEEQSQDENADGE